MNAKHAKRCRQTRNYPAASLDSGHTWPASRKAFQFCAVMMRAARTAA